MLKKLTELSVLSLLSISLFAGNISQVKAVEVEGKVILNALSRKIVSSVDTFYQGRDKSVRARKTIEVEGDYDEADVPTSIDLEEDTDESAKYSFEFPAVVSSVISDLFAKDFGRKGKLKVNLKSVNSVVGSFVGELENEPDSSDSVESVSSVGSVSNVNSSLRFVTTRVRAVRKKQTPDVIRLRGVLQSVAGLNGSKRRLAKGRFTLNFSQD
ncbi:MAG: hypothetical protein HRT47_03335 [Candidatus Caenarcaniphilales bacterium]|nr:hypothetical protein [Candidatus Caenarcaniphilales bacterium]